MHIREQEMLLFRNILRIYKVNDSLYQYIIFSLLVYSNWSASCQNTFRWWKGSIYWLWNRTQGNILLRLVLYCVIVCKSKALLKTRDNKSTYLVSKFLFTNIMWNHTGVYHRCIRDCFQLSFLVLNKLKQMKIIRKPKVN